MNIFANRTIQNIANNRTVQKIASKMCNYKDALLPVIMLESTVIAGRSYQAYKRGGKTECRERLIDETISAVIWFKIISWLNTAFEKLISKKGIFHKDGLPEIAIDFGSDAIRHPLKNAIQKRPEIGSIIGGLKVSKIVLSALIGIYFSGMILPKFYQNLTKKILRKEKEQKNTESNKQNLPKVSMREFLKQTSGKKGVSFRGAMDTIHTAAHILENNPIARLLTVDAGLFAGRAYSARNNDERVELLFRDMTSSFFYLASTPIIYFLLSRFADKFKGKNTNVDPNTANFITEYINKQLKGKDIAPKEFIKLALGDTSVNAKVMPLLKDETMDIFRAESIIKGLGLNAEKVKEATESLKTFIKLRPQTASQKLVTKSEILNALQGGFINNAQFLTDAVEIATHGASQKPNKFISFVRIDKIKHNIKQYTESISQYAQNAGKNISADILQQVKTRNLFAKVGYTLAGLVVSSAFLSTIIPKLQYKITEWRTGSKEFPGIKDIK